MKSTICAGTTLLAVAATILREFDTKRLVAVAATCLMIGCSSTSTFHKYRAIDARSDSPISVAMDAEQRVIIAVPITADDRRQLILCAEPSPDIMSEIGSGISIAGSVSEAQRVAFAQMFIEAAEQIGERNATIQLLRDGLYRQCEAYLNGLISEEGYKEIADRYVDAMVTLLAIERLTAGENSDSGSEMVADNVKVISSYFLNKDTTDKCFKIMEGDDRLRGNLKESLQDLLLQIDKVHGSVKAYTERMESLHESVGDLREKIGEHVKSAQDMYGKIYDVLTAIARENESADTFSDNVTDVLEKGGAARLVMRLDDLAGQYPTDNFLFYLQHYYESADDLVRARDMLSVVETMISQHTRGPIPSISAAVEAAGESVLPMKNAADEVQSLLDTPQATLPSVTSIDQNVLDKINDHIGSLDSNLSLVMVCKKMLDTYLSEHLASE